MVHARIDAVWSFAARGNVPVCQTVLQDCLANICWLEGHFLSLSRRTTLTPLAPQLASIESRTRRADLVDCRRVVGPRSAIPWPIRPHGQALARSACSRVRIEHRQNGEEVPAWH